MIETAFGLLGSFVFMFAYQQRPMLAMAMVGFHIGISSYRWSKSRQKQEVQS